MLLLKNLAFEALKQLLNDEIRILSKRNIVQGKSFIASINVKLSLSSCLKISKPLSFNIFRRSDNLPSVEALVASAINKEPLFQRQLQLLKGNQPFLPIKDKEKTTTSKLPSGNGTDAISQAVTLSFIATWSQLNTLFSPRISIIFASRFNSARTDSNSKN